MLEKEAYGKLKKMCNTLDDIKKLLSVIAEKQLIDLYEADDECREGFFDWAREQNDKTKT